MAEEEQMPYYHGRFAIAPRGVCGGSGSTFLRFGLNFCFCKKNFMFQTFLKFPKNAYSHFLTYFSIKYPICRD